MPICAEYAVDGCISEYLQALRAQLRIANLSQWVWSQGWSGRSVNLNICLTENADLDNFITLPGKTVTYYTRTSRNQYGSAVTPFWSLRIKSSTCVQRISCKSSSVELVTEYLPKAPGAEVDDRSSALYVFASVGRPFTGHRTRMPVASVFLTGFLQTKIPRKSSLTDSAATKIHT